MEFGSADYFVSKISTFEGDGEDAMRTRAGLIHWSAGYLAHKVSNGEQIDSFLLILNLVDR